VTERREVIGSTEEQPLQLGRAFRIAE
jgi:hypothetical protein